MTRPPKTPTYDIITVRWNEPQYKVWRHWVDRTCPTAKVHWIPDTKPFPWNWAGGKVPCFDYGFDTRRVIYIDTDTIVTHDLEPVFEMMGDCKVGASYQIPKYVFQKMYKKEIENLKPMIPYKFPPISVSSGMIVTTEPDVLYEAWAGIKNFAAVKRAFGKHRQFNEFTLSLALTWLYERDEVWDIPLEIHGNIISKRYFGNCMEPWVIHYHRPERLINQRLGKWLDVDNRNGISS